MTSTAFALNRYAGPPAVPGYVVDEFLGRGSAAVVWSATHVETGKRSALKLVDPDAAGADAAGADVEGIDREERLGQRVSAAHLLAVQGRVELDDGRVALVLPLADGSSLRDVVSIRGALPLGEVVTAVTPLATTVAELHEAGVVHSDIAPGNVLFTTDGRPMLADLSSAWLVDDGWPERSRGTPGFAAPEVLAGRPPVPGSDVWSLGALVWYARTGGVTPPEWVGDLHWTRGMADQGAGAVGGGAMGDGAMGGGAMGGGAIDCGTVADVTAAVGPELTPLLLRMLADDPEARPSGAEVALALYRAAAPEPVRLVGHHPDPAAAVTTRIRRDAAETRSRSERRDAERAERRRDRVRRRRDRVRRLVPWVAGRRSSSTTASTTSSRPATSTGSSSASSLASTSDRVRATWRSRLAIVAVVGVVLTGGMLGLLWATGGPLEMASTSTETTPSPSTPATATAAGGTAGVSTAGSVGTDATTGPTGNTTAIAGTANSPETAAPPTATNSSSATSGEDLARDPVAALQRLADQRAAALVAAEPRMLVNAESAGSPANENDRRTVARLRDQGQRYAGLSFTVRSAEVLSVAATTVVLRAVVDRSAYQVTGGAGGPQAVGPGAGTPLRYTMTHTAGGWRLAEVGPP